MDGDVNALRNAVHFEVERVVPLSVTRIVRCAVEVEIGSVCLLVFQYRHVQFVAVDEVLANERAGVRGQIEFADFTIENLCGENFRARSVVSF